MPKIVVESNLEAHMRWKLQVLAPGRHACHAHLGRHLLGWIAQLVHAARVVQAVLRVTRGRGAATDKSPAIFAEHPDPGWLRRSLDHEHPLPLQRTLLAQRQGPARHRAGRGTHHGPLALLHARDVLRRHLHPGVSLGSDGDGAGAVARAELGHIAPDLELVEVQPGVPAVDVLGAAQLDAHFGHARRAHVFPVDGLLVAFRVFCVHFRLDGFAVHVWSMLAVGAESISRKKGLRVCV